MDVKPGYKLTELGVIPKDWGVSPLGRLSEFVTSGSRGWAAHYSDQGPLFVRSQNIRNGSLDFTDRQCVMPPTGSEGSRTRLNCSDLLITITGNSVGNVAWVEQDLGEAYISQHVGLVRLLDPSLAEYICLFLAPSSPGNRQIAGSQSGQSKPGLNLRNLEDFLVALPSRPEQRAIATALSDVDALLGGLDRLIAKKRDLKQAAMQQLLTGQTRLPGFHDEWVVKQLREAARFCSGSYLAKDAYRYGEFEVQGAGSPMGNHDAANFREAISVIGRVGTVGRPRFMPNGCWVNNNAAAIVALPGTAAPRFVHLLLMTMDWSKATSVTAQPFLVIESLMKMEFQLPPVPEQTAIAAVLTDMDAELAALEQRRAKTRALKQGMMQELLTGRTRLVTN